MTHFGTSGKNPPWMRTAGTLGGQQSQLTQPLLVQAAIGGPGHTQQQAQQQATSQAVAYNAGLTALGLAMEQQRDVFLVQNATALQPGTVLSQPGVAIPTSLASVGNPGLALPASLASTPVATVSYPTPRVLQHSSQFQQPQPISQISQPPPQHTSKQRVFTGTVNKLHENFGFVDDDVFFQITCVKGTMPKVGDRVLVEASYNPNMPFKWNATRIQVLPNQTHIQSQTSQNLIRPGLLTTNSAGLGANSVQGMAPQITLALASQPGTTIPPTLAIQQLGQTAQTYNQVPPPVSLHNLAHVSTSLVNRMQGLISTRQRHSSPPLRREREIRRDERRERERHREREMERERPLPPRKRSRSPRPRSRSPARRRIRINPRYVVQIPKVSLDVKEANVMELRKRYPNLYVPSDFFLSSFSWIDAFSLSHPFVWERSYNFHIMSKEVENINESNAVLESSDVDHSYTAKVMLLSAPMIDDVYQKCCALAEDPNEKESFVHPTRLISFLVGLKNKNEIMAIGGSWSPSIDGPNPDKDRTVLIRTAIRTCRALTGIDLGTCTKWYRFAEINYYRGETMHKGRAVPARVETVVLFLPDVWSCTPTTMEWQKLTASYKKQLLKKLHEDSPEASENQDVEEGAVDLAKKDNVHQSEVDPKSMKIAELRHELEARNMSCKGLKTQLVARLTKALKAEQNKEEENEDHVEDDEVEEIDKVEEKENIKKKKDDDDKKKDEKERAVRRYALPDSPSIIVHPSVTAKGGKFDCTTMSLSVLLDYRQEDNKEYSFEVSLFAELFNEMLARDFGFRIYCALAEVPEKKEIEDKEKEKKKSKEKNHDKDQSDDSDVRKENYKKDEKKKDDDDKELEEDNDEGDEEEDEEEMEDDDCEKRDKKKDKKKEKDKKLDRTKTYTVDPNLLLAFVYFDQNHCGYLLDKDLEEMIHMLGLNLSRAQVRKLVQNVTVKERLYYRKLTDKKISIDEQEKCKLNNEKAGQIVGDSHSQIDELAKGNKKLPVRCSDLVPEEFPVNNDPPDVSEAGLVLYNGALLKIEKLFDQLERSEKSRMHAENRLMFLQDELNTVKETASTSLQSKLKLISQLSESESKFKKLDCEMKLLSEKHRKFENILVGCHNLIKPVVSTDCVNVAKSDKTSSGDDSEATDLNRKGSFVATEPIKEENGDISGV